MSKKTKYRYVFMNGDIAELQIVYCNGKCANRENLAEWIEVLTELDRLEYNINHKESRRHCSLDTYNQDETLLPAKSDGFEEFNERETWKAMCKELTEREAVIGELYFIEGYSHKEIAMFFHINRSRVTQIITRIRKKLKKFL